jgi:DNA-binding NarL/FixJ family response regulator
MSRPIRVMVVDDHPLLREGIAAVLGGEADLLLVAEAANGRDAIERFREHRPDVTLMDLQMPEMDGVAAMLAIREECSDARILVLTTYGGDAQALRALKAGASGYLLKSAIRKELIEAIRIVHAGQRRIPQQVASEIAAHVTDDALSARELEVLKQVAAGSSNRRVAAALAISEDTVKAHMKNIMSKLGANDRTHAVTIALKRGMIEL